MDEPEENTNSSIFSLQEGGSAAIRVLTMTKSEISFGKEMNQKEEEEEDVSSFQ
jgi:hypothetical protein